MTRSVDWDKRCEACWLHRPLCLCDLAPRLETRSRVVVVMDAREMHQTTNTGHLAPLGLARAQVWRWHRGTQERSPTARVWAPTASIALTASTGPTAPPMDTPLAEIHVGAEGIDVHAGAEGIDDHVGAEGIDVHAGAEGVDEPSEWPSKTETTPPATSQGGTPAERSVDFSTELAAGRVAVLFPGLDSVELTPETGPLTLVVPDATWRMASRMVRKTPWLDALPRVCLPPGPPATRWLRRPPREDAVSTLEAIARAMGVLEGPEVQTHLEHLLAVMMDRHLWSKGKLAASMVTGGVPLEALRGTGPRARDSR